jgi:predicted component of type VI protein secretion system
MSGLRLLKVRLSLKGRPIKTYTFKQDAITVGRSPECDIALDNPSVSREHCKLEMTSRGYYAVEDLGSANGVFLNDQPVKREFLMNNDVVRVGKFSMWVSYDEDRRGSDEQGFHASPQAFAGTTVLSTDELEAMIETSKRAEEDTTSPALAFVPGGRSEPARKAGSPRAPWPMIGVAFVAGVAVGAIVVAWILT